MSLPRFLACLAIAAWALWVTVACARAQDAAFWGNAPSADGRSAVSIYPVDDGLHVADLVAGRTIWR